MTDFPAGAEGDAWYYGILDQFWQPKQAAPEHMRKFNAPVVLLLDADMSDRCIWTDQGKSFKILISHFGPDPIRQGRLSWRLISDKRTLLHGNQSGITVNVGDVKEIATANLEAFSLEKGETLELIVELKDSRETYINSWPIWAFPRITHWRPEAKISCQRHLTNTLAMYDFIKPLDPANKTDVLIASRVDRDTQRHVREGGKLILFLEKNSMCCQSAFPLFLDLLNGG